MTSCRCTGGTYETLRGSWSGLVGLALTLSARKFAKEAQTAASAAKTASEATERSIGTQSLVHALSETRRLGAELLTLLSLSAHQTALVRARDMDGSLRYLVMRWQTHVGELLPELREAQSQLEVLIGKLAKAAVEPLSIHEAKRLSLVCQRIVNAIINAQAFAEQRGDVNADGS